MTTIHVKRDIWKKLNSLKEPGESMNEVIERLLAIRSQEHRTSSPSTTVADEKEFDALVKEFVEVLSENIVDQTIDLSRSSFSKEVE